MQKLITAVIKLSGCSVCRWQKSNMAADGYIGHYVKRSVNADQLYQTVTEVMLSLRLVRLVRQRYA